MNVTRQGSPKSIPKRNGSSSVFGKVTKTLPDRISRHLGQLRCFSPDRMEAFKAGSKDRLETVVDSTGKFETKSNGNTKERNLSPSPSASSGLENDGSLPVSTMQMAA